MQVVIPWGFHGDCRTEKRKGKKTDELEPSFIRLKFPIE